MPTNRPIVALAASVVFVVVAGALVLAGHGDDQLVTLIVSTVPSMVAAGYAERASRDVRNGTVTEKARQGTHIALAEAGVVTREGPVAQALTLQSKALSALLRDAIPKAEELVDKLNRHEATAREGGEPDG